MFGLCTWHIIYDQLCLLVGKDIFNDTNLNLRPTSVLESNRTSSLLSNNNIHNCVLRLGGFHMCMSFLGAIGRLMQGSGISSVFEQIYAELSDGAILSGKEMSRGTRVHIFFMEHWQDCSFQRSLLSTEKQFFSPSVQICLSVYKSWKIWCHN